MRHEVDFMKHIITICTKILATIALIVAIGFGGRYFGEMIPELEGWVTNLGLWGPLVFTALFIILTGMQLPESILAVAAGVAFGLAKGIVLVVAVNFLGAIIWFWIARWFLKRFVTGFLEHHPKLEAIEHATTKEGFKLMILLRLGPFSYGFINFALGASDSKFKPYLLSLVGVIPGNIATVYFGSMAAHVAKKAAHADNLSDAHFAIMGFGFLVTIVVVIILTHVARHALKAYEHESILEPKTG
jgi:uncharacterized membrane protein YdjX (TVP38/TMEM64 family)